MTISEKIKHALDTDGVTVLDRQRYFVRIVGWIYEQIRIKKTEFRISQVIK